MSPAADQNSGKRLELAPFGDAETKSQEVHLPKVNQQLNFSDESKDFIYETEAHMRQRNGSGAWMVQACQ
jgi:hypothetical protein